LQLYSNDLILGFRLVLDSPLEGAARFYR